MRLTFPVLALIAAPMACRLPSQDAVRTVDLGRAWLTNLSTWQQAVEQEEGRAVDKRVRGVFPVGDGHVFGYHGLGRRANTAQGLSGPSYQTREVSAPQGHWGELSLDVLEGGAVLALPQQRVARTRAVNVVHTEDAGSGVALRCASFASFGSDALWRIVEVVNTSDRARKLAVRASWSHASAAEGGVLRAAEPSKGFEAELLASREARASGKLLQVELGELAAKSSQRFVLALRTRRTEREYQAGTIDDASALAALDRCKADWDERLAGTMRTNVDDRRLTDLLEDWKVLMLVQRCADSGAVAPMVNYRGTWIRDNTGPMLAFLRYGLFDEAKALLDYVYHATLVTRTLQNHFPLDLDVSKAAEIEKSIRWDELRIPSTELAAWMILQHEWYYRATWDIEFLEARWPFLSTCYRALRPASDGSFATHGDETYLHGAFYSLFPDRVGPEAALPADAPGRRARSFDNSMLYLIAINAMSELVEDLDKHAAGPAGQSSDFVSRRKSAYDQYHVEFLLKMEQTFWDKNNKRFAPFVSPITGEQHPAPYAPVNLRPQWIGYTYAIGEKNRENLKSTLNALWQKDGRVGMTPTTGYVTGAVQGLALYSLVDLEDQRRDDAFRALVRMAGPAGEWGELYDPEGRPISGYNAEYPNRLRPWESGINIDAIFFMMNGMRFVTCPGWSKKDVRMKLRMPGDAQWFAMRGVQHDAHRCDIFVDRVYRPDYDAESPKIVPESRMRFRVEYDRINKKAAGIDWIDAAVNVGGTLYMRLPTLVAPIYEITSWPVDKGQHWLPGTGATAWEAPLPALTTRDLLVLTSRLDGPAGGQKLDLGQALRPEQMRGLLLNADGSPRVRRVLFDVGVRSASRATMKTSAWWKATEEAFAAYEKAGGKLMDTAFFSQWKLRAKLPASGFESLRADMPGVAAEGDASAWTAITSEHVQLGQEQLGAGASAAVLSTSFEVDKTQELILKVACSVPFVAFLDGKAIALSSKVPGSDRADRFETLVRLEAGERRLSLAIFSADGRASVRARLAGVDGLPRSF